MRTTEIIISLQRLSPNRVQKEFARTGVTRNTVAREYCRGDTIPKGIWSLGDTID